MKTFVNEYQYTPDIVSESLAAWWGKKFRKGYIEMGICIALIVVIAILSRRYVFLL